MLTMVLAVFVAPSQADLSDGLTNLWLFDETSGGTAAATFGSADWTNANSDYTWSAGMWDNALEGTNSNMVFYCDSIPEMEGTTAFTISVWMFADLGTDFWSMIVCNRDGVGMLTGLDTSAAPAGFMNYDFRVCGASINCNSGTNTAAKIVDQAWNHIVITWTNAGAVGDALNVWINGYKVVKGAPDTSSGTYGAYEPPGAWRWVLGQDRGTSSRRFEGKFDELAMWTRVLSDAEVETLYLAGAGNSLSPQPLTVQEGSAGSFDIDLSAPMDGDSTVVTVQVVDDPNATNPLHAAYEFDITDPNFVVDVNDWDIPQNVLITPDDDTDREEEATYLLCNSSTDTAAFASPIFVELTITDNDTPQIVMTGADDVVVAENAGVDSFDVELSAALVGGETVTLTLSADPAFLDVSPTTVAFDSSANPYNVAQTVTVTAVSNADADNGTVPYEDYVKTITIATVSSIPEMSDAPNVDVTILEDDCGALGVEPLDADGDCDITIADLQAMALQWLTCHFPNRVVGDCL